MKTVTLKLAEVLNLEAELAGVQNPQTGEIVVKGLLGAELDLVLKYHLDKIYKQVAEEKKAVDTFRDELIKKYGKEDENKNISIPYQINVKKDENGNVISADINPDFEKFSDDMNKFLETTTEIKIKELSIDAFSGIKLRTTPSTLFSLLEEVEEA